MKKPLPARLTAVLFAALALVLTSHHARAVTPLSDVPKAVVRMPSHGASATVVATEEGRTFLLTCAHAFEGNDRVKPIKLDGPGAPQGPATLNALDDVLDLALIEVKSGPVPYVAPIAGPGFRPSKNLLSVGFDNMKKEPTQKPATIIRVDHDITWTKEPPWHGRSGGALLDLNVGQLFGVVSGYMHYPQGPGLYVSHNAIERFMTKQGWASPSPRGPPQRQSCPT